MHLIMNAILKAKIQSLWKIYLIVKQKKLYCVSSEKWFKFDIVFIMSRNSDISSALHIHKITFIFK